MSQPHVCAAEATLQVITTLVNMSNLEEAIEDHINPKALKNEIDSIIKSSNPDKPEAILLAVAAKASNCLDYLQDDTTMVEDIENWLLAESGITSSVEP